MYEYDSGELVSAIGLSAYIHAGYGLHDPFRARTHKFQHRIHDDSVNTSMPVHCVDLCKNDNNMCECMRNNHKGKGRKSGDRQKSPSQESRRNRRSIAGFSWHRARLSFLHEQCGSGTRTNPDGSISF